MPTKFEAVSFENNIGQTINPGDAIICVTVSTGRLRIRKGRFLGVNTPSESHVQKSYRWEEHIGYRYEWQGEYDSYTYGNGNVHKWKKYVKIDDPTVWKTRLSYYGRIYKLDGMTVEGLMDII